MKTIKGLILGAIAGVVLWVGVKPAEETSLTIFDKTRRSVVMLLRGEGGGTGFVLKTPNGNMVIVTNRHICDGQETLIARSLALPRDVEVRVIEESKDHDLCVVEAPRSLKPLELGAEPSTGDKIFVSGHPRLLPLTISEGLIRGEKTIQLGTVRPRCNPDERSAGPWFIGEVCLKDYIVNEVTAKILPGNSGSPLLNSKGKVIGVMFAGSDVENAAVPYRELIKFLAVY